MQMHGKVKWFDAEKGYGFIIADDGNEYFAHIREIDSDTPDLKPNDRVSFAHGSGPKGLKALGVRAALAVLLAVAVFVAGGCDAGDVQQRIDKLQELSNSLHAAIGQAQVVSADLDVIIESMPPGDARDAILARKGQVDKAIAQASDVVGIIDTSLVSARRQLEAGGDGIDAVTGVVRDVAPVLPTPWNYVALFAATTGAAVWRWVRAGKQAKDNAQAAETSNTAYRTLTEITANMVRAIEAAKDENGVVNFQDDQTAKMLDMLMGRSGKDLVDRAQDGLI